MIQLAAWNIGPLTSNSLGLVDTMKRRRVNVAFEGIMLRRYCLRDMKWKGRDAKELTEGYKLYCTRKNKARNGVGIVVNDNVIEKFVGVNRLVDDLIAIKRVLEDSRGYERVHVGQGFGESNELGEVILEFTLTSDHIIANTYLKKERSI